MSSLSGASNGPLLPLSASLVDLNPLIMKAKESSWEMKATEDYLRSEMKKLSVKEQTEALDDIYCVGEGLKGSPQLIQESLAKLEVELQRGSYPIYELALDQNRSYVEDPSFRLKFLLANKYNVGKAATQMENFLRHKATYFGFEKVSCDISLDDLTTEEISILLSGVYHLQGSVDHGGRVIVYTFNKMLGKCSAETQIRVMYYLYFNIVIPIPGVQQKGVTSIHYDESTLLHKPDLPDLETIFKTADFFNSLPLRVSAMHFCLKPVPGSLARQNVVLGFMIKALSRQVRTRVKLHYGNDMELQGSLRRYGVPSDTFPVDATNGKLRKETLNVWFHLHMATDPSSIESFNRMFVKEEDADEDDDCAMTIAEVEVIRHQVQQQRLPITSLSRHVGVNNIPSTNHPAVAQHTQPQQPNLSSDRDVYLGRGRDIQNYPGNVQFRQFLATYHNEYDAVPRHERGKIAKSLMDVLKGRGVRFFQRNDAKAWVECDSETVEKKVGQLLREFRKKKNKNKDP